jgi:hypothetical protein
MLLMAKTKTNSKNFSKSDAVKSKNVKASRGGREEGLD